MFAAGLLVPNLVHHIFGTKCFSSVNNFLICSVRNSLALNVFAVPSLSSLVSDLTALADVDVAEHLEHDDHLQRG